MNIDRVSKATRQHMIGIAKQLFEDGFTSKEVAAKMCVSESTVRSLKKIIDEAKENSMK